MYKVIFCKKIISEFSGVFTPLTHFSPRPDKKFSIVTNIQKSTQFSECFFNQTGFEMPEIGFSILIFMFSIGLGGEN